MIDQREHLFPEAHQYFCIFCGIFKLFFSQLGNCPVPVLLCLVERFAKKMRGDGTKSGTCRAAGGAQKLSSQHRVKHLWKFDAEREQKLHIEFGVVEHLDRWAFENCFHQLRSKRKKRTAVEEHDRGIRDGKLDEPYPVAMRIKAGGFEIDGHNL